MSGSLRTPSSEGELEIDWPLLGRRLHATHSQTLILRLLVELSDPTLHDLAAALPPTRNGTLKPSATSAPQIERLRKRLGVHSRAAIIARAMLAWHAVLCEGCGGG